jgi:hypothetical protein
MLRREIGRSGAVLRPQAAIHQRSVTTLPSRFGVIDHGAVGRARLERSGLVRISGASLWDLRDHAEVTSLTLYLSLSC